MPRWIEDLAMLVHFKFFGLYGVTHITPDDLHVSLATTLIITDDHVAMRVTHTIFELAGLDLIIVMVSLYFWSSFIFFISPIEAYEIARFGDGLILLINTIKPEGLVGEAFLAILQGRLDVDHMLSGEGEAHIACDAGIVHDPTDEGGAPGMSILVASAALGHGLIIAALGTMLPILLQHLQYLRIALFHQRSGAAGFEPEALLFYGRFNNAKTNVAPVDLFGLLGHAVVGFGHSLLIGIAYALGTLPVLVAALAIAFAIAASHSMYRLLLHQGGSAGPGSSPDPATRGSGRRDPPR